MEVMEADKARAERRRGWKITAAVEAAAAEDDDGDEEEEEEKEEGGGGGEGNEREGCFLPHFPSSVTFLAGVRLWLLCRQCRGCRMHIVPRGIFMQ